MWKQIVTRSAGGVVQGVVASVAASIGGAMWAWINLEILFGSVALVVLWCAVFFGMKLMHLPRVRTVTQVEYDALKTLKQVKENTFYVVSSKESEQP